MSMAKRDVEQGCSPPYKRRVCPDRFATFWTGENSFKALYGDVAFVRTVAGYEGCEGVEEGSKLFGGYRC